ELAELHLLRLSAGEATLTGTGVPNGLWRQPRKQLIDVLALRELGEQTSSLADPRCHYAIRAAIDDANRLLREAEDGLFIGGGELAKSDRLVEEGQGAYRAAAVTAEKLTAICALRDRAWSELPYLAQWFCRSSESNGTRDYSGIQGAARALEEV